LVPDGNATAYVMGKKHLLSIMIIVLAILLIAIIIWIYAKKIEAIEMKMSLI
jgi:hypothetical protein